MNLKPAALHILVALADRDLHGYAAMQAARASLGGQERLNTASFYRHLGRLIDAGLVAETPRRPAADDPRRGAYYRLTPAGRVALEAERRRLVNLVAALGGLRATRRRSS
jgi:DNA-binding PadR family transcriptional regulator